MADFNVKVLEPTLDFDHLPYWDVVIIGAGPAGLAAGLTTAHRALTTLIIEAKDRPGGQPQFLYADKRIVDIPGFPDGITGEELSERTYRQAVNAHVQFRFSEELVTIEDTEEIESEDRLKRVVTAGKIDASCAIVQIGFLSAKDTFERLAVKLNEDGSISIDPYFETSREGLFAVGDVHGDIKLIAVAWAEGIQAAINAFKEITSPYWLSEKRLRDNKIALIGEKIARAARSRKKPA
jgi:thioredoxin reductase